MSKQIDTLPYVVSWQSGAGKKKTWLYDFSCAASPGAAHRKKMEDLRADGVTDAEVRVFELRPPADSYRASMDELAEGVELLRPHYPGETDAQLQWRVGYIRPTKHITGHWPSAEELAARAAREREEKERLEQLLTRSVKAADNVGEPVQPSDTPADPPEVS